MKPSMPLCSRLALLALLLIAPNSLWAAVCDGISDAPATALTTVRVPGTYLRPLFITAPPGDTTRLFIVEQDGTIRIVKDGVLLAAAFLDVSALTRSPVDGGDNEQGLLGLAFHPDYATNRIFFIYHTDSTGVNNLFVRYTRDVANPDLASPASRQVLVTFPHPSFGNHNGGMMAFAPDDGRLYLGTGDGGSGCDPNGNAQNPASLLGKLHRIDVDAVPIAMENWAIGLRNPWRWSIDRLTADLYIGDVGQNQWEEIDYRPAPRVAGENYGWVVFEGSHCPNPSCAGAGACNSITNPIMPILEYSHAAGCSITGGYVYRGCRMSGLSGRYFFADYCSAFIDSFRMVGGVLTDRHDYSVELAPGGGASIQQITSFGEDARGEIYIADRRGQIYKIVPILPNLQVSGMGAELFSPGVPDWSWENLQLTSGHPIAAYHVYRSTGNGSGTFDCVFQSPLNTWSGGDASVPAPGSLYSYLVTAVNASGQETSPGTGTGGTPRTLSALACPP
jgi:glucose/arabinose dehydrogenase